MILLSNHLLQTKAITIDKDVVIRINIAWVRDEKQLKEYLDIPYTVFLDYPIGRKKPPVPSLTIDGVIKIMNGYDNVKFFAISNSETYEGMKEVRDKLPKNISLVPKIETKNGILNIERVIDRSEASYIMLDREDLFSSLSSNNEAYIRLVKELKYRCKEMNIKIF